MNEIEAIKEEIKKAETILIESRENLANNPDNYSAKLLALSTENHLMDLSRKLDLLYLKNQNK